MLEGVLKLRALKPRFICPSVLSGMSGVDQSRQTFLLSTRRASFELELVSALRLSATWSILTKVAYSVDADEREQL